jgi:hypothetical protein
MLTLKHETVCMGRIPESILDLAYTIGTLRRTAGSEGSIALMTHTPDSGHIFQLGLGSSERRPKLYSSLRMVLGS